MRRTIFLILSMFIFSIVGCDKEKTLKIEDDLMVKPTLYSNLGTSFSVPDGLAIDKEGSIFLAVPNYLSWEKDGSKIVKINPDGNAEAWYLNLPLHEDTGRVHPMGMEFGPDGNLYIADNQYFSDTNYKSRLLRIIIEDGKPIKCEVVVEGFKLANAVRFKDNFVYVSDTYFDLPDLKHQSGIYKISIKEMNSGVVKLLPFANDSHLLAQFTGKDFGLDEETAGADGVCFDSKGNLYTGNFGDGVISKIIFDKSGNVEEQKIVIDHPSIECCDGITCDPKTDKIYITNSKNNSVHVYNSIENSLALLWINGDVTGENGLLDQPCEPLFNDNKLIVVNFDMSFPGLKNRTNDVFNTISMFKLD